MEFWQIASVSHWGELSALCSVGSVGFSVEVQPGVWFGVQCAVWAAIEYWVQCGCSVGCSRVLGAVWVQSVGQEDLSFSCP